MPGGGPHLRNVCLKTHDGRKATGLAAGRLSPLLPEKSPHSPGTLSPYPWDRLDGSASTGSFHSGFHASAFMDRLTLETCRKPLRVIPEKSAFLSKASRTPTFGRMVSRS